MDGWERISWAPDLIAKYMYSEAPEHIRQLIEWGTNFDREQGELQLGREGGHSERRIVHARDATGAGGYVTDVWANGVLLDSDAARISPFDHGLLVGG